MQQTKQIHGQVGFWLPASLRAARLQIDYDATAWINVKRPL